MKGFIEKIFSDLRDHLRRIFGSNKNYVIPPTGRIRYVDKDNYKLRHPNYKRKHQRHEQKK